MKTRILSLVAAVCTISFAAAENTPYAELRVIDAATNRGVPLVTLETVNHLAFVTDNAGRVAFNEPGLLDRELHFTVKSHGYAVKKDGFGIAGVRVTPRLGQPVEIKIERTMIAERVCRLTGEGTYRDSILLGHAPPFAPPTNPGLVAGQDSIQTVVYKNRVYCFWGDTNRMEYPLGLFRMAGATIPVPDPNDPKSDPSQGVPYDYFTDPKSGFARAMMPLPERPEGVVWIFGVFVVPDETGDERLVGHYSRRKGLTVEYEHGIAVFNDAKAIFEPVKQLPLTESWRRPDGYPIRFEEAGKTWLLFGSPNPNVRVPATLPAVLDPERYEAFTRTAEGKWVWQKTRPPTDSKAEAKAVTAKTLRPEDTRYLPADAADPSKRITLHSGSVRWNAFRKTWILLAGQVGGTSHLGEVWYAESDHPTGPFTKALKVITHDRQTFYNVCHQPFWDRDGGRTIFVEGTYTSDFSGNPFKTPRYDYNQVLYRIDLSDERLNPAHIR